MTLTVLVENLVFVAQQCATLPWNQFVPAEFTEQGDVEVRVEEDKLLLRRPSGKDLRARILKRALLRTRVDLEEFWRRNSADREEGAPLKMPQENGAPFPLQLTRREYVPALVDRFLWRGLFTHRFINGQQLLQNAAK